MNRPKRCSVCGELQRSFFVSSACQRIECGTWDNLTAEVGRLHNLRPEVIEQAIRDLLRFEANGGFPE